MLVALIALAAAAPDLPPVQPALATGARARRDSAAVIGNEDYATLPDAAGATADASAVSDYLLKTRGVPEERVHFVGNGARSAMRSAVVTAAREVRRGGTLWIYCAGHGALASGGRRVLLGTGAAPDALGEDALPLADVLDLADRSKAKQVFVILDVGFGGRGREGELMFPPAPPPAPIAENKRINVWYSATHAEPSFAWPAAGHGIFTYFVMGAMRGWADGQLGSPADGTVTLAEAQAYVAKVVRSVGGGEQKPSREPRAAVTAWPLAASATEAGPSRERLAAMALSEKARRVHKAEGAIRATARTEWAEVSRTTTAAGPASEGALRAFIITWDTATVLVDGAEVAVAIPEVAEARARLDGFSRAVRKITKKKRLLKRAPRVVVKPPAAATAPCADLLGLEPTAISGELTPELIACVEARLAGESRQTTRDKLSRMLLINADARGDTKEWLRLTERHLEEVDRSDPELCFKYALALSRGDIDDAPPVLKWSGYALENKHLWEGETYMSRVYNLLRLRAETASRLWHEAEADFLEERSEENADLSELARGQAKDFAREWLDYARSSGQPTDFALVLCKSAAGSSAFCESG